MNFSEITSNISEKFSDLSEKLNDFVQENKATAAAIGGLILLILVCLILLVAQTGKKKKAPEEKYILELSEPLVIPPSPELPKDYNISRKTSDKWTEEEADKWFTVPSDKEINSLASANENLVNEIIGAAP